MISHSNIRKIIPPWKESWHNWCYKLINYFIWSVCVCVCSGKCECECMCGYGNMYTVFLWSEHSFRYWSSSDFYLFFWDRLTHFPGTLLCGSEQMPWDFLVLDLYPTFIYLLWLEVCQHNLLFQRMVNSNNRSLYY